MGAKQQPKITVLVNAAGEGDPSAARDLLPLVYDELRELAAQRLAREPSGLTLQPTALVHEAFLRLLGSGEDVKWNGRGHFFGAAALAMRRILIERARRTRSLRRDHATSGESIDETIASPERHPEALLAIDDAIESLSRHDERVAHVTTLHIYAGLGLPQIAESLGISERTCQRDWRYARAWLVAAWGESQKPAC